MNINKIATGDPMIRGGCQGFTLEWSLPNLTEAIHDNGIGIDKDDSVYIGGQERRQQLARIGGCACMTIKGKICNQMRVGTQDVERQKIDMNKPNTLQEGVAVDIAKHQMNGDLFIGVFASASGARRCSGADRCHP